ncbi:MAG TPA: SDR family oxidoreductase, partial [Kofleriaceae bacterium]
GGPAARGAAAVPCEGAVLVTGAAGQLGRALIAAWRAAQPGRPIIALVRAPDREAARRRLGPIGDQVEVICGDVARPELGVDDWRAVAARTSTIVHAAAHLELGAGWDAHAAANVDGTAEVARLAAAHGLAWHHVSTLSVFVSTDRPAGVHREAALPDGAAVAHGGYAQTKLAAEAIARAAGAATIFRLGLLVAASPRPGDQLAMTVRGLARLGAVPDDLGARRFDVTPLDHAAAAIVALVGARSTPSTAIAASAAASVVHHLASPTGASFAELVAAIRAAGAPLAELSADAWAARARDRLADPDIAMAYLSLRGDPAYDLFLATGAEFDVARTQAVIAARGLILPPTAATLAAHVAGALEARP